MRRVAGEPRRQPELTVDYADVLRQAVENERWRVLRQVRAAVAEVPTTQRKHNARWDFETDPLDGDAVKNDALVRIDRLIDNYEED